MKFLSIDIETTGLDWNRHQIIEIGAIIDEIGSTVALETLPRFHCFVTHTEYIGEAYALQLNAEIFRNIAKKTEGYQYLTPSQVGSRLYNWILQQKFFDPFGESNENEIIAAGKKFDGFDKLFLTRLPEFNGYIKFYKEALSPTMLYFDPKIHKKPPTLSDCIKAAELGEQSSHKALDDALMVIKLLRKHYSGI